MLPEAQVIEEPAAAPASLSLTWPDAVELVRSRRGDVFEIQFLGREYDRLRASDDPSLASRVEAARERLRAVVERRLQAKGLLEPGGRLELLDC